MKKVFQTNIRKVYNPNVQNNQTVQQESQMHAVKKIHNLLSSGAVTVTGPNQSRITKPQSKFQTSSAGVIQVVQTPTHNSQPQQFVVQQQQHQQQQQSQPHVISSRCYVCDEPAGNNGTILNEALTSSSSTKFPNKIGQIVGDAFMVIISVDDVLCKRCTTMINQLDRLENDIERVKQNLLNMLYRKYGLSDDTGVGVSSPPVKMQKLNSGNAITRKLNDDDNSNNSQARKITIQNRDPIENQLSNLFEGNSPESTKPHHPPQQGPVQQMKIISPQIRQQQLAQEQQKKGPIKIYKCMSCEFKTTDLKQFQPHYETCKQQNGYACKTCRKTFTTLPSLRQHIAEKHPTEFTCNICNINFQNEITLKKHLEINHPEMKPVNEPVVTQLFTCNMCAFTSSDKASYEEHVKKHAKLKPFKCRLCSTRFETREQANIHAKSHQANYFKCGSCSASFSQKEMLLKHFETHEHKEGLAMSGVNTTTSIQQKPQMQPAQQQIKQHQSITTQKLLQDTIDEALRESDNLDSKGGIHFFSCNICSLTFIQETYYNQHMETHKQDKKVTGSSISTSNSNTGTVVSVASYTNPGTSGVNVNKTSSNLLTTSGNGIQTTTNSINSNAILDSDIESIFEKLHSDKSENEVVNTTASGTPTTVSIASSVSTTNENFVITTQENATGSITFNVTIPKNTTAVSKAEEDKSGNENITVGISMPVLDQPDEESEKSNAERAKKENPSEDLNTNKTVNENDSKKDEKPVSISSGPVSMPSLDDDTDVSTSVTNTTTSKTPTDQSTVSTESNINTNLQEQKPTESQQPVEQSQQQSQQQSSQENQENQQHQEQHIINSDQVSMELEDIHNAESGQIKFILNENGQIIQLDNHIITTDADGNQILVQDSEQIQQLLQNVGILHSGDGLDGETLQMIQGENNQMIIVQGDEGPQLIDASLLNADGHIVIQQQGDGEIGEGAHAIGEDGVRIPVSVAYTADGQQVVTAHTGGIEHHHDGGNEGHADVDDNSHITTGQTTITTQSLTTAQSSAAANSGNSGETFFALEDLIHQSGQKQE